MEGSIERSNFENIEKGLGNFINKNDSEKIYEGNLIDAFIYLKSEATLWQEGRL